MLSVLQVVSGDLWAGAEVQAYTLVRGLAEIPGIHVSVAVLNDGELSHRLERAGVEVFVLDERRLGTFEILRRLRRLIVERRPGVIHSHREKENIVVTLANRATLRVPAVRTFHGRSERLATHGLHGFRQRLILLADRWCIRAGRQYVVAVSSDLGDWIGTWLPRDRLTVIENGIAEDSLSTEEKSAEFRSRDPYAIHVGYIGRLVAVKRVDLFISAAQILRIQHPERKWRFHVFGDGPLRSRLESLSMQSGVADITTFHGHRMDIAQCIRDLDATVLCSDHEGLPMVALEAAVLGVPMVAHRVGGLPDVLPSELLVDQHDAAGYAAGVMRAVGANGRAIAETLKTEILRKFSAAVNSARTAALYRRAVADAAGGQLGADG